MSNFLDQNSGHPFALYVWDLRSHMVYVDSTKIQGKNAIERIRLGYSCLDDTVAQVLQVLVRKRLLENTIVVGFGDHGDELWTHALNDGFCHANEPYTNLISTPAFIYDRDQTPHTRNELASLIDLKSTCLGLLGLEDPNEFECAGINLFRDENKFVYSQNLFANQKPMNSYKRLVKSYSATNYDYHLIVSEHGTEMYAYRLDPTNHSNLLSFFEMDNKGEIHFINRGATHAHFHHFFSNDQINHIKNNYYVLSKALVKRVLLKNRMIEGPESFPFDVTKFLEIRPRNYDW